MMVVMAEGLGKEIQVWERGEIGPLEVIIQVASHPFLYKP